MDVLRIENGGSDLVGRRLGCKVRSFFGGRGILF